MNNVFFRINERIYNYSNVSTIAWSDLKCEKLKNQGIVQVLIIFQDFYEARPLRFCTYYKQICQMIYDWKHNRSNLFEFPYLDDDELDRLRDAKVKTLYQVNHGDRTADLVYNGTVIKIQNRCEEECTYAYYIIDAFYKEFSFVRNYINVTSVYFDDKNGNIATLNIDCNVPKQAEIGAKYFENLDNAWLYDYSCYLKWNVNIL